MVERVKIDLKKIEEMLLKERDMLLARLKEDDSAAQTKEEFSNLDRADLAQSYTAQEREALLTESEEGHLIQIEAALQKLNEGKYGLCDNCGQPIAPGRLEVLPYAQLCIRCKSEA